MARTCRRWFTVLSFSVFALALLTLMFRCGADDVQLEAPGQDSLAAPAPAEFDVLTYNVQARPWLDDAEEKLPKIAARLKGHDIVCIQECFQRHDLLWQAEGYPNKLYFGRLSAGWKLANSGLSTLTRLPVSGYEMTHYNRVGEFQNAIACKGILLTRCVVNGMPLDVYNTHMEAGDTNAAHDARDAQAAQVVEWVNRNSPVNHNVILVGDFNMGPRIAGRTLKITAITPMKLDLQRRTEAFQRMRDELHLRDAFDELFGPVRHDIERVLFRPAEGCEITPLASKHLEDFQREDGLGLSDDAPHSLHSSESLPRTSDSMPSGGRMCQDDQRVRFRLL